MRTTLTVALDVSAIPEQLTGAGVYVHSLAAALTQREDISLSLISRRKDAARWAALDPAELRAITPNSRPLRLAFGELILGRSLRKGGVDVVHGPHYTMPRASGSPVVVTVHDLTLVEHPEWHEPSKVRYFGHAISYAARHADRLICVSEHTARRLRERYSPACPVDVIPHGIDHGRFAPSEPSPGADAAALAPLALPERYGLFLGTLEPRKNLELLVEAFDQLAEVDAQLSLVLAGKRGWGNDALDRAISGARHKERIVELGYVEASAVPALLRKAAVVAYPSKEEGFGLPALEALACGTALVTTENSVMAELAGGAAWFCSGEDRDELAAVLEQALEQAADRREVGILRAASFSWERCAAQHVESYTAALD